MKNDKKPVGTIFFFAGKNGSGKDFGESLLVEILGKVHLSHMRHLIASIAEQQKVHFVHGRNDFTDYTYRMRKTHGAGYFVEEVCKLIPIGTEFAVINSMRHPIEYDIACKYAEKVVIIAVLTAPFEDSSPEEEYEEKLLRYNRLTNRGSITDKYASFDDFIAQDKKEWEPEDISDPNAHWVKKCVQMAIHEGKGFSVLNNGNRSIVVDTIKRTIEEYLIKNQIMPTVN